jgi:hypothetical protein
VTTPNQLRPFKEIHLAEADRQRMIKQFKEEGLTDEEISNLIMTWRHVENPRGLNEIIFEVSGRTLRDDSWDKDLHINSYIGRRKTGSANRMMEQMWGKMMEQCAFQYLEDNLKDSGWLLKNGEKIHGKEFDCLGWRGEIKDCQNPDLAIEMTFPIPKEGEEFFFLPDRIKKYRVKLKLLKAKYNYILIGVSRNKTVTFLEIPHSDMTLKFQGHKFKNVKLIKRSSKEEQVKTA